MNMKMMRQLVSDVERQIDEVEAMHSAVYVLCVDGDNEDMKKNKDVMIGAARKMMAKAYVVYKEAEGVFRDCERLEGVLHRLDDAVSSLEDGVDDAQNNDVEAGGEEMMVGMAAMAMAGCAVWVGFGLLAA
jgi:hypothetical protein